MCGGFAIYSDFKLLSRRFGAEAPSMPFAARYNARPTQYLPVILNTQPDKIFLSRWGLRAPWNASRPIINTRKESLDTKAFFRTSFKTRRCLVLSDGFFEWAAAGGRRVPHYFFLKSGEPFAFAGLYQPDPETQETAFTIVTCEPNEIVAPVHNRMPALLPLNREKEWLAPDSSERQLLDLLQPFPAALMADVPVSIKVNSARNDSPDLLEPSRSA